MSTKNTVLDVTQYVKINDEPGSFLLQSHGDTVRIVFSDIKPARDNNAFHEIGGQAGMETMLQTGYTDNFIWVLAMTTRSKLTITSDLSNTAILTDRNDREAMIAMTGELNVGFNVDDISLNFQYATDISTHDIKDGGVVSGTGVIGYEESAATISTGTGVGSSELESVRAVRYKAGHEVHGSLSIVFGEPEAGVNQYAGFLNNVDGWCVGYQGLDFGLWFIADGITTFIPQSDFNLDTLNGAGKSHYNMDPTKGQVYRLTYTWHGFLDIVSEVRTSDGRWVPFHKLVFVNQATEPHFSNPNLPLATRVERITGTGSNVTLKTGSWRAGLVSGILLESPSDRWFAYTELQVNTIQAGVRNNIFTFYNKPLYHGKINHVSAELTVYSVSSELNKTCAIYLTKNAVITGGTTFTDIDSVNSTVQVSAGGTLSDGVRGGATVLKSGGDRRQDVRGTGIFFHPGEYLNLEVIAKAGVSGDFHASLRFVEYH